MKSLVEWCGLLGTASHNLIVYRVFLKVLPPLYECIPEVIWTKNVDKRICSDLQLQSYKSLKYKICDKIAITSAQKLKVTIKMNLIHTCNIQFTHYFSFPLDFQRCLPLLPSTSWHCHEMHIDTIISNNIQWALHVNRMHAMYAELCPH